MGKNNQKKKNQQNSTSDKKNNKLAFIALAFLIVLLVLAKFLAFLFSLWQPTTAGLDPQKNYTWRGDSSINLVFRIKDPESDKEQLSIINFQPSEQKIIVLHLANQIYTEIPKGFGEWQIGNVYNLGQEENQPIGAKLLKMSVSKLLGLPVDGVVLLEGNKDQTPEKLFADIRRNPLGIITSTMRTKTDLTPAEMINFFYLVSKVRVDKTTSLDLEKSVITESKLLPDSSRVLGINTVRLDTFIREKMADDTIIDGGESVGVFNATKYPGLAQEAARMLTNLGANVVILANTESYQAKSAVTTMTSQRTSTVEQASAHRFKEIFAPRCLKEDCGSIDPKIQNSRATINIILGEDFYLNWYTR